MGEFLIGQVDVQLGEIGGNPFYISRSQHGYWKRTQLAIDAVDGRGGTLFLEGTRGRAS